MANTTFSKNLRKLRESKKIPQKSAAASLGISQALLSHYEKGIRECGLDFLARAAKFYGVTTDFLLGIASSNNIIGDNLIGGQSEQKSRFKQLEQFDEGIIISCIPDYYKTKDSELQKNGVETNTYAVLYKHLLINALSYIFDEMKDVKYKDASILSGKFFSLMIYRLYTLLYNNHNNHEDNHGDLTEKIFMTELKYISALKDFGINNNLKNIFEKYNFENPCLNNIINSHL